MGYSGRYHAASLAAVFIALAIGILIGIGLADDVVSTASQELEQSIRDERDQARDDANDLRNQLDTAEQFSDDAYPALVKDKLARQKFAVVELGDVPDDAVDDTANEAIDAAEQGGAELASVSSIELPPGVQPLADSFGNRFKGAVRDPASLERLGRVIGLRLSGDGKPIDGIKSDLFSRFNGTLDGVSRLVLIRNPPDDLSEKEQQAYDAFEKGLIEGAREGAAGVVGVERSSTDPTTLGPFSDNGVSTVDNAETPAGKVSIVYALDGSTGDFGTKDGATSLLPELLLNPPSP